LLLTPLLLPSIYPEFFFILLFFLIFLIYILWIAWVLIHMDFRITILLVNVFRIIFEFTLSLDFFHFFTINLSYIFHFSLDSSLEVLAIEACFGDPLLNLEETLVEHEPEPGVPEVHVHEQD
jgi:hypothetical protein